MFRLMDEQMINKDDNRRCIFLEKDLTTDLIIVEIGLTAWKKHVPKRREFSA